MLTRAELDAILAEVKNNHARLDGCVGPHDFTPVTDGRRRLAPDERCSRCGGTTDAVHAHWYKRGLEHGRKEHA